MGQSIHRYNLSTVLNSEPPAPTHGRWAGLYFGSSLLLALAQPAGAVEPSEITKLRTPSGLSSCKDCFQVANPNQRRESGGHGNGWIGPAIGIGVDLLIQGIESSRSKEIEDAPRRRFKTGKSANGAYDYDPKEVQTLLNGLGYNVGAVDGDIGSTTRKRIREFQKSEGLKVNGRPSSGLVTALKKALEFASKPKEANKPGEPDQTEDKPKQTEKADQQNEPATTPANTAHEETRKEIASEDQFEANSSLNISNDESSAPPPALVAPPQPQNVCGPDVTAKVHGVLVKMHNDWWSWSRDKRNSACGNLVSFTKGLTAWDINELSPDVAPISSKTYEESFGSTKGYQNYLNNTTFWFEGAAKACAIPRPQCGASVQFLGICMHSQVVNYVQWGFLNRLCDQETQAGIAHSARNTFNGVSDTIHEGQLAMVDIGKALAPTIDRRRREGASHFSADPGEMHPDMAAMAARLARMLKDPDYANFLKRPSAACSLTCPMTGVETKTWDAVKFRYRWTVD